MKSEEFNHSNAIEIDGFQYLMPKRVVAIPAFQSNSPIYVKVDLGIHITNNTAIATINTVQDNLMKHHS